MLLGGLVAAVGGTYDWATLPFLAASTILFVASGARVASSQRAIDAALLTLLAAIACQLISLPAGWVVALSPAAARLQDTVTLEPVTAARTLSVHAAATRQSLMTAAAAALLFWASRDILSRGGVRIVAHAISWIGAAVALVAVTQHVTAPASIYWLWSPFDPGARPYGPFINRNHLATWLILAISLAVGYLAARARVRLRDRHASVRALIVTVLSGELVGITAAIAVMVVGLVSTLSRSGLIGLIAASMAGAAMTAARTRRAAIVTPLAAGALLLALGFAINGGALAGRIESTLGTGPMSRRVIWQDTWRMAADFPVTGTGLGTFADAMLQYQQARRETLFNQAHNEILHVIAEGGLLVSLPLVVLAGLLAREARRAVRADRGALAALRVAAICGVIGVLVQGIWETGLHTPANLALAAVLTAIAVRPAAGADDPPRAA